MSLTSMINVQSAALGANRIASILWITTASIIATLIAGFLLGRLGLPAALISFGLLLAVAGIIVTLSLIGRTMTSPHYFFAGRSASSAVTGFSGGADWAGGAFFLVFVSMGDAGRAILATTLFFGIFLSSVLFASAFHKAETSTLAGYFSWRFPGSAVGIFTIPITSLILLALIIAEFAVARETLTVLVPMPVEVISWSVLILAVLPTLIGGWVALSLVNVVLILCILTGIILPTFFSGLFPNILVTEFSSIIEASTLLPLQSLDINAFAPMNFVSLAMWSIILSAGISVLPHAISRMSLVDRPVAAQEHAGWSALFVFVVIAAIPLSLDIIFSEDHPGLTALATYPVLHNLPYLALLLIAFNGLSATLLAFSGGLVRGIQRRRNRRPGERSMFTTRLFACLVVFIIGWQLEGVDLPVFTLFLAAICAGAAVLFLPLISAIWISGIPGVFHTLAVAMSIVVLTILVWTNFSMVATPLPMGLLEIFTEPGLPKLAETIVFSMLSGGLVLASGYFAKKRFPAKFSDPMLSSIRREE